MAENVTCTQKVAGSNRTMDEISNKILYRILIFEYGVEYVIPVR
jgi:hypothetical protein